VIPDEEVSGRLVRIRRKRNKSHNMTEVYGPSGCPTFVRRRRRYVGESSEVPYFLPPTNVESERLREFLNANDPSEKQVPEKGQLKSAAVHAIPPDALAHPPCPSAKGSGRSLP
jgi:hypothetical protein